MKAHMIETYGVHIGWAVPMLGGWLVFAATKGFVCFAYDYESPREILENYWTERAEGSRVPSWT